MPVMGGAGFVVVDSGELLPLVLQHAHTLCPSFPMISYAVLLILWDSILSEITAKYLCDSDVMLFVHFRSYQVTKTYLPKQHTTALTNFTTTLWHVLILTLTLSDREAVDYIVNASDLMDLGKDTGRLDGEVAGTKAVGNGSGVRDGDEDGDDEEVEKGRGGKSAMGSKKLRTNLEKGEVRHS